jgi:hypothetical protein
LNPDASDPRPTALDYAEPPAAISPAMVDETQRLVINFGTPSQAAFAMRIGGMSLLVVFLAVTAFAGGFAGRLVLIPFEILAVWALYHITRNRLEPDIIVADADGLVARGPTTGVLSLAWKDIASFRHRHTVVFGTAQLCVKLVPDTFFTGEEHPLAWADRATIKEAVNALNDRLGPRSLQAASRIPKRVRIQNWVIVSAVTAASVSGAFVIVKMAINFPVEQTVRADLWFVAAIIVGTMPPLISTAVLADRRQ